MFLGYDRPRHHKSITQRERKYIENSLGQSDQKVLTAAFIRPKLENYVLNALQ